MDSRTWVIILVYSIFAVLAGYKFLTGKSEWLDRNEVASKITKILLSLILGYFIAGFYLFYLVFKFIAALVRGR